MTFTPSSALSQAAMLSCSSAETSGIGLVLSAPFTATTPKQASGKSSKTEGETSNLIFCISLVTCEYYDLPLFGQFAQQLHGCGAAGGIEIGQSVVQDDGAGVLCREGEVHYRQAHG